VAWGVALWVLPEMRTQAVEESLIPCFGIPGVEQFLGTETKGRVTLKHRSRIKDVRQRTVTKSPRRASPRGRGDCPESVTRTLANIRVRLVISDAYDVVLGEKVVYCGNLLTDAGTQHRLAEAEIQREAIHARGTDVSNQRDRTGTERSPSWIVVQPGTGWGESKRWCMAGRAPTLSRSGVVLYARRIIGRAYQGVKDSRPGNNPLAEDQGRGETVTSRIVEPKPPGVIPPSMIASRRSPKTRRTCATAG